ncbi:MAG: hypothetical protein K9M19_05595 [Candidatus Marinimicrobia bacterium]|nr:hypothetical protein [Candidatus Neomarinimicrobiota bacterium]
MSYLSQGDIGFPASPPAGGWPEGAIPFLVAMGITDAILIVMSEIFVIGFFKQKAWSERIGLVALAGSMATALVFALGTLPSGAWWAHPVAYGGMTILFVPYVILFIQLMTKQSAQSKEV